MHGCFMWGCLMCSASATEVGVCAHAGVLPAAAKAASCALRCGGVSGGSCLGAWGSQLHVLQYCSTNRCLWSLPGVMA
jgi:hypothetical protein